VTRRLGPGVLDRLFGEMESEARVQLAADGFPEAAMRLRRSADLRYHGQSFELTIPVEPGPLDAPAVGRLDEAFAREHERTYGHRAGPQEPIEVIGLRLIAHGVAGAPRVPERIRVPDRAAPRRDGAASRRAYFGRERGWLQTPVVQRTDLHRWGGGGRSGPLIVEEYDATGIVPPGWHAALDPAGNLDLTREGRP
jgi:N-methylhydantoinase A